MSTEKECTIVFADICGSTSLFEKHGDVVARGIVKGTLDLLIALMEENGGHLVKTIGDEIMCTFSSVDQAVTFGRSISGRISGDSKLMEYGVCIRLGMHSGTVIEENNDIHGDAVNVASRMASIAKPEEIIATKASVDLMPSEMQADASFLSRIKVHGKQAEIEVYQITSEDDFDDLTSPYVSARFQASERASSDASNKQLVLKYKQQGCGMGKESDSISIGRDPESDIVVSDVSVSRKHVTIEYRMGKFILCDHSKHGTALRLQRGGRFFVHREEIILYDEGEIALGKTSLSDKATVINYVITSTDVTSTDYVTSD